MASSKNKKGLGKGIDAIFSEFEAIDENSESVVDLKLDEIRPNPYQPRKTFDEHALNELAKSIEQNGVFQPIIVRESVNGFEIIAGERRFRASKIAKKETIPAIVRPLSESGMMEIAVLENLQREDLTPLEEADAYQTLISKLNLTQEQVSQRLGKSRPYIANYLRLLNLPESTKQLVQSGSLSMGQARTLLSLKDPDQIEKLAQKAVDEDLTVRQLEQLATDTKHDKKKAKKATKSKSPFVKATEDKLVEKFDTQVAVKTSRNGHGKLEIDFTNTDDLNRILDILGIQID
ncbi:ParB/RepB/Spo0J family partition protein [Companilactobacillus mishanensis]|uniref:ParB/RepB/Spo0J family partition protein n=1 Tax=Companilactobacillus mishanensis TaxID=2486008 RepID=A0A5P0ZHW4_9LACO|nr:ParB/RepB/Spo0J family partition protein [Companilactobacillus mishanensis]MQS45112.1 ParB/RepB/Spo0J family partition protein [Companilactobacillus mishanensis]MQS52634.1 ParB/RepB/Spo0J family partition protein [Companilactobacillus mishanensis]MQS90173.1 ParB/RepB/Spo0J family partition protein [Companilactobacillus mishanensis]